MVTSYKLCHLSWLNELLRKQLNLKTRWNTTFMILSNVWWNTTSKKSIQKMQMLFLKRNRAFLCTRTNSSKQFMKKGVEAKNQYPTKYFTYFKLCTSFVFICFGGRHESQIKLFTDALFKHKHWLRYFHNEKRKQTMYEVHTTMQRQNVRTSSIN